MSRAEFVSVFFPEAENNEDKIIRVHAERCTHIPREWRAHGKPVKMFVESVKGIQRHLARLGVRYDGMYVLPCCHLPEGFWSKTPDGERLKMLDTYAGARRATQRFKLDEKLTTDRPAWHAEQYNVSE